MRKIVHFISVLMLALLPACGQPAPTETSMPVIVPTDTPVPLIHFVIPVDGATVEYDELEFQVNPVPGAEGFAWTFIQDGKVIFDTIKNEQRLTGTKYRIPDVGELHDKITPGEFKIQVRARINGVWTEPSMITVHLPPRAAGYIPASQRTPTPASTANLTSASTESDTVAENRMLFSGSKIVFTDGLSIFMMDADGTNQRQLANADWLSSLSLSANGEIVAYSNNFESLAILSADGTRKRNLPVFGKVIDSLTLSPDGKWVAYTSNVDQRKHVHIQSWDFDIVVSKSDGSSQYVLTKNKFSNEFPAWAPDGSAIAYVAIDSIWSGNNINDVKIVPTLNIVDINSRENKEVQQLRPGWIYGLDWSPDGKYLAFASDYGGDKEIYIIQPDGGGLVQLTNDGEDQSEPVWLPDSRHLLFTQYIYGSGSF